jgi:hypothetical protein
VRADEGRACKGFAEHDRTHLPRVVWLHGCIAGVKALPEKSLACPSGKTWSGSAIVTVILGHRAALRLAMRAPQYPQ